MAERLPVYEIDDFEGNEDKGIFYMNTFAEHFRRHPFITKPHRHSFYIIVQFTAGYGSHIIDFVNYSVSPGSLFFLMPAQVHHWSLSPDTEGRILFFKKDFIEDYFSKKISSYSLFNAKHQLLQMNDPAIEKQVSGLIGNIQMESGQMDVLRDYLDILLIKLGKLFPKTEARSDLGTLNLQKLEALIEQHYTEQKPPAFYADQLNFSVKYLNDLCRKYLNKTTTKLIHERILLEAKRLLTHDNLSIKEIAIHLNFEDHAYFTRLFKKMTGKTPGEFRMEMKLGKAL